MPPKKKARPEETDLRAVKDWIVARIASVEAARRGTEGRVVLRRLNRLEYSNTIHDLLDVRLDLKEVLALDSSMDGFDNVGAALHLSSFAMDRYLEAADKALSAAIVNRPAPPSTKKRYSLKEAHNVARQQEPAFRVVDDTVICFTSVNWQRVSFPHFWPNEGGFYRFRISACAVQTDGKPVTFEGDGRPQQGRLFRRAGRHTDRLRVRRLEGSPFQRRDSSLSAGNANAVKAAGGRRHVHGARPGGPVGRGGRAAERDLASDQPPPDLRRPSPGAPPEEARAPRGRSPGADGGRGPGDPRVRPPCVPARRDGRGPFPAS
jgi:hypothetical protein